MENELFKVLLQMINVQKYPSVPYDIYRYFTLLEDLDKERSLVFNLDQKDSDISCLSYDQINQLNFSRIIGTHAGRQIKIRMIDDEAMEAALHLINTTLWPDPSIKSDLQDFIENNVDGIHLYIRDITTMVYTIFVFLSLRRTSAGTKTEVFSHLNQLIKNEIGAKDLEEEKKEPEEEEWVLWGKDNKQGQFLIIEKTSKKETSGTKCINKRIPDIKLLLDKEHIRDEYNEFFKNKEISGKRGEKKILCNFLKQHLIEKKRYYIK